VSAAQTAPLSTLIVIAKEPRPGRVKTRLVPPLTHEQAARLADAAIWDTLRSVAAVPAREFLLAFDGNPEQWLVEGWRSTPQPDGTLAERLIAAFGAVAPGPAVLVGMDTPQLRAEHITAWDRDRYDACLGRAADGGWWAIGFADPRLATAAISGIPTSRSDTGARQLDRLTNMGLRVQLLDELTDVDTIESARTVAALVPTSAFAAALRAVPGEN
jgi:glycosyltransferase A (GT-A) superfamily protein (DUF2064 family)